MAEELGEIKAMIRLSFGGSTKGSGRWRAMSALCESV
jgi:hypothetical protein